MSNIIKGVDFGMGYEEATKWEPGLDIWFAGGWDKSRCENQDSFDWNIECGHTYRRKLPILANHPNAIPLEPGEVLQFGERYLTRKGKALTYFGEEAWGKNGKHYATETRDIIARLPKVAKESEKLRRDGHTEYCSTLDAGFAKVACDFGAEIDAKASQPESEAYREMMGSMSSTPPEEPWDPEKFTEAEKAKEEKVESGPEIIIVRDINGHPQYIVPTEGARLYLENESVRAEVKRQEEAKRIGPGDLVLHNRTKIEFVDKLDKLDGWVLLKSGYTVKTSDCVKLNLPPDLIAALNAEIDAKAGG